jgi:uroporphyrinogen-III synthase
MSLPRPRVLITRAEPGASLTATRLAELGLEPIVEPLLTLQPLPVTSIPAFDALAFTSPNGARLFAQLSPRRDAPVFCVGQRTADVARQAGFPIAMSSDGDVVALAQVIARHLAPGARLLHAGNAESRGGLTERLRAIGCSAEFLAIYAAQPPANPGPILARHLAGDASFDAALIHSPRAGTILGDFLAASPRHATVSVAAISQAAADPLIPHAHRLAIAAEPNELALLTALDDLFGDA